MQQRTEHEFDADDNQAFHQLSEGLYRFSIMTGVVGLALIGLGVAAMRTGGYGSTISGPGHHRSRPGGNGGRHTFFATAGQFHEYHAHAGQRRHEAHGCPEVPGQGSRRLPCPDRGVRRRPDRRLPADSPELIAEETMAEYEFTAEENRLIEQSGAKAAAHRDPVPGSRCPAARRVVHAGGSRRDDG